MGGVTMFIFVSVSSRLDTHICRNMLMPAEVGHLIKPPLSGTPLPQVSAAGSEDKRYHQELLSYQKYQLPFWI